MNNTLLSICVPSYNRSKELCRLVDSIDLEENIELVVCDDGSTDNTKEVLDKYIDKYLLPTRIRRIVEEGSH